MKRKGPPSTRPPFSSRITQQVNFNSQMKLPFSLNDQLTIEALNLSGIQPKDLEVLPLQHFIKASPTEEIARIAYQRHLEKRKDLIQQVLNNREMILSTLNNNYSEYAKSHFDSSSVSNYNRSQKNTLDTNYISDHSNALDTFYSNVNSVTRRDLSKLKDSGELIYEKYMDQVNRNQLCEKEKTNNAVLRKLAISQLRQALRIQKGEQHNEKVDHLSKVHSEKINQIVTEGQELADKTVFGPPKHELNYDDCLFYGKVRDGSKAIDDKEREKKYKQYIDKRNKKFQQNVEMTEKKTIIVKRNAESEWNDTLTRRIERLDKSDYRYSLIEGKFNQRDQLLNQRGEMRKIHSKDVNDRNNDIEKRRVQRALTKMNNQSIKSKEVLQQNKELTNQKIIQERNILKKRNEAADHIFTARRKKLEDFGKFLDERDENISAKIQQQKEEEIQRLNEVKIDLENRTEKILRAKRSRDVAQICMLRQKIARNNSGLTDTRKRRAKSEFSKVIAEGNFAQKREQLSSLMPKMINMSDEGRIENLVSVLNISKNEAEDILATAKRPVSIH
ncbi:hypothetical protein M9Y10_022095 [Tritrichomonas musculus]|uniref:Uncharacterized protein n=1 Tax=Tritrichomonas musculus TaxID=1915356 RepID=A0ABR2KRJ6_9EUKA